MSASKKSTSLRNRLAVVNPVEKRNELINEIKTDYEENGAFQVTEVNHRNIMLIGRTRTGKSTIKSLLVNPTVVPDQLTLKSGTRDPLFESFHVGDNQMVLNIIDTPGLFEHGNKEIDVRDNSTILNTIEICINREITMFHVVCFCVAMTTGINQEDIESLKLLVNFLGEDISKNSCLIVTRCESIDDDVREKMAKELFEDNYFHEIAHFFKLGIYFSGSLNPDDYNRGNDSLLSQFVTISDYREKLIKLFTSKIEPFPISDLLISDVRRMREHDFLRNNEFEQIHARTEEQSRIIEELTLSRQNDRRDTSELINRLKAINIRQCEQFANYQARHESKQCIVS